MKKVNVKKDVKVKREKYAFEVFSEHTKKSLGIFTSQSECARHLGDITQVTVSDGLANNRCRKYKFVPIGTYYKEALCKN